MNFEENATEHHIQHRSTTTVQARQWAHLYAELQMYAYLHGESAYIPCYSTLLIRSFDHQCMNYCCQITRKRPQILFEILFMDSNSAISATSVNLIPEEKVCEVSLC